MSGKTKGFALALAALAACLAVAPPALAAPVVDGEFAVSGLGVYNAITTGPDGNIWVTLDGGTNDVARITPAGDVQEFNAADLSNPVGITTLGGELWVTQINGVARFSPDNPTGAVKTFTAAIGTPHAITVGSDGHLWTASGANVVEVTPTTPPLIESHPGLVNDARGTAAGGDGNIWVADPGGQRIVSLTTAGTAAPGSPYSAAGGGPQGIAAGPGTQMAFTDPLAGPPHRLGRITPGGGDPLFTPIGTSDPFGITFAADGAYWVGRFSTNDIGRLTPEGEFTTLGGFSANAGPRQLTPGPNNTLWVTLQTADKVARVTGVGPEPIGEGPGGGEVPPPPPTPNTRITRGPKGKVVTDDKREKVTFRFRSTVPNSSFRCELKKEAQSNRAALRFRACDSPKSYRLAPGSYEFRVRAIAAGVRDPTPAHRSFRIVRERD